MIALWLSGRVVCRESRFQPSHPHHRTCPRKTQPAGIGDLASRRQRRRTRPSRKHRVSRRRKLEAVYTAKSQDTL